MTKAAPNSNYQAWHIDAKDFPASGTIEAKIRFLTGYGVLAPSTHNTQPWLFEVEDNHLRIAIDPTKQLEVGDPDSWGLFISIGSCVENIVQASNFFGLSVTTNLTDEVIELVFAEDAGKKQKTQTLQSITNRHSDKLEYSAKAIPPKTIADLQALSSSSFNVTIIEEPVVLDQIIDNHLTAATEVASDPDFGRELAAWLRSNNTLATDGMPGFVVGNSPAKSAVGAALIKKKPLILQKLVKQDKKLLESSPAIVVLSINHKSLDAAAGIESGRNIEKFWLALTEKGLVGHPLFASIQNAKGRSALAQIIKTNFTPVFLMRIGYSNNQQLHTPRANTLMMNNTALTKLRDTLKSRPVSHSVDIGKYKINYVIAGQGKPVLLIHGANIGWAQWHLNIDALAKQFKVYALDLPGAGDSTKVNFRKTDFKRDYEDVVDKFVTTLGLSKIDIVGSSFGGWIAMSLAIKNKPYIKNLIVTNPIGFTKHMPVKFRPISVWPLAKLMSKTALKPKRSNKNLEKFMRDVFYKKDLPLTSEFVDYFYELSKDSHNVLFISRLAHFSGMRKELFLGSELPRINNRTLIIWGKEDPLMPYKTVKNNFKLIKNAEVKVLENVGHMPPVEAAAEFNKLVIGFLGGGKHEHD